MNPAKILLGLCSDGVVVRFEEKVDQFKGGVSRDSLKSHQSFKAKMGFPFELIADTDEKLCKQFDVIRMKNM